MDALIKADEDPVGNRSASPPPGRESREDWRSSNNKPEVAGGAIGTRSRSRSPIGGKDRKKRGEGWGASGSSNTSSGDPHMQRARLFVGNIEPNRTKRGDLHRLFSRYGEVLGVSIHKGFAFVQMDRERNANRAANYEDNQMFMGSRIHVEFSQAALKAGAKFERLPARPITPPPVPPPLPSREREELALLDIEREREQRLARILQMEKELATLRNREDTYDSFSRRSVPELSPYDRGTADAYRRHSPPLPPREYGYRARDEPSYRSAERSRSYYERVMERELDQPIERGFERPLQRSISPGIAPRDAISYPLPGSSRSQLQSKYGEREGLGGLYGMPQRTGSQLPSAPVGYGNSSKPSASRETGVPPPGWPSSDYDKVSANRPPFAGATPWS